jgi:hypothetical protein
VLGRLAVLVCMGLDVLDLEADDRALLAAEFDADQVDRLAAARYLSA